MGLQYFVASVFLLFGLCNSTTDTITPSQPIKDGDHLVSNDETFALGFFSPGNGSSNRRYAGIWYNKISEQNSEQNVVWVANRDSPINGTSGVISINQYGNLVIYDDNTHNVAWQSNVSATEMATNNSYSARLLDSGNLVVLLQGGTDNSLWQSFDYPTNTALPKFKLGLDRRTGLDRIITSWRSIDDPGTGDYSFRLDPSGLPQLVLYKGTVPRWRTSPWIWAKKAGNLTNSMFNINYIDNPEEVSMVYYQSATIMSKILVDHLGTVKADSCQKDHCKWNRFYSAPDERCDNYGRCGENGYCDGFKVLAEFECSCLPGYEPKSMNQWNLRDASGGCVNKRGMCGNGEGFVKVEGIKLPDTSRARVESRSLSMKECEVVCRKNCSCTAYTSGDEGNCITWHGSLMDAIASYIDTYYMYIRVDADELARRSKENSTSPPSYLKEKSRSPHGNGKKIVIVVTSVVMSVFVIFLICWLVMKKTRRDARFNHQANDEEKLELPIFAMISIAAATNNFSETNKIGEGGFGPVYKGQLSMGKDIAVKRLSTSSKQGVDEFKNEVILIAKLQHRNLVRLLGCCIHGEERMLVYEYMPNGSLDSFIFGSENKSKLLTWTTRLDIIVGIARGVVYLHQDSRLRIVHRDLKVSNVLLDGEMNPKISDFGLARTFGSDQSSANTRRVVGTYGYMSPEYVIDGHFSMKSDVFSFGVIVLEIINGNRNRMFHHLDHDLNLLGHAWKLWIEGRAYELLDQRMEGSLPMSKALRCIHIGLLCVQKCLEDRPTMSSVLSMLVTDTIILPQPKQPGFYTERSTIEPHDHPQAENTPSINEVTITRLEAR